RRHRNGLCRTEQAEQRLLLSAANDLASLSDEFTDAGTTTHWQRINEVENWNADQLQIFDINQTQAGRMVMAPHTVVWYQNWRGPMAFKEVTGDFVFTTQVFISDRDDIGIPDADDIPDEAQFSLGGAMIRTPRNITDPAIDWQPGSMANDGTNNGENYVFLSMGHGTDGQYTFEVKTTRNSNSQLELTPTSSHTATIQLARIGNSVIAMLQLPGQDWIVHRRYSRPDMPETLQVGIVSYSDWGKAGDFDPFYHNGHTLDGSGFDATPGEPYNPDLMAGYEYARYVRPQIPLELVGVDLVNTATDQQLLSFLGDHANLPGTPGPDVLPNVSVTAVADSTLEQDGNIAAFQISRTGADMSDDLEVMFAFDGTATAGLDYNTIQNSIIIPAGAASIEVQVAVLDDAFVEGTESLSLRLVDEVFYEIGQGSALVQLLDNDFESVEDQTMGDLQDALTVALPATHPDGTVLVYSASLVGGGLLHELDQQYDFFSGGSFYLNWGGLGEKWFRGDQHAWFYVLPSGILHRWSGNFETSEAVADVGVEVFEDPTFIFDAPAIAEVSTSGNEVTFNPVDGFVGAFEVDITTSNGYAQGTQRIMVSVVQIPNNAPDISPVADQTVVHNVGELRVPFTASDPDGDTVTTLATVIQPAEYQLDQQYGFVTSVNDYQNWGGQNERWVRATTDGQPWFYILPDGQLHRWTGSFESSPLIESLNESVYSNLQMLTDAQPLPVTAFIEGDEVVLVPDNEFIGAVDVSISASDGITTSAVQFSVTITNEAPVLGPIGDLTMTEESLNIPIAAFDADGDTLHWSVEVLGDVASQLNAQLDLQHATSFHTNWGGHNEKWLQSSGGDWFYILQDGSFYRWMGTFESSELLESLDTGYYDNPNLIADSQPLPVVASITDGVLSISVPQGFHQDFSLRISVTDGLATAFETLNVWVNLA
ncbi:MAG: hypothetical protein KDA91_19660, partial [Planctomycetaceae bacterium]|nr:hypothetical protein [Planctomycetaceae bacterium]